MLLVETNTNILLVQQNIEHTFSHLTVRSKFFLETVIRVQTTLLLVAVVVEVPIWVAAEELEE